MTKELVIAISLGLFLGAFLTFGVYTANQALKSKKVNQTLTITENLSPSPTSQLKVHELTLESPENNLVVNQTPLKIMGKTSSKAIVVIYNEEAETIVQADEEGLFNASLPLLLGSNKVIIQSFSREENELQEKKLDIVYTTQLP